MREESGFTLIELILVVVIIGILAGAVTLQFAGRSEEARIARARSDINEYQSGVDLFAIDNNDTYPKSLNDLFGGKRNYVRKVQKDPWGKDYVYVYPGKHGSPYDIFSTGKDGISGNEDDVTSWGEPPTPEALKGK
jgi:general secretion pathway protein G